MTTMSVPTMCEPRALIVCVPGTSFPIRMQLLTPSGEPYSRPYAVNLTDLESTCVIVSFNPLLTVKQLARKFCTSRNKVSHLLGDAKRMRYVQKDCLTARWSLTNQGQRFVTEVRHNLFAKVCTRIGCQHTEGQR